MTPLDVRLSAAPSPAAGAWIRPPLPLHPPAPPSPPAVTVNTFVQRSSIEDTLVTLCEETGPLNRRIVELCKLCVEETN